MPPSHLVFWTFAWLLLGTTTAVAWLGQREMSARDVGDHRRAMRLAGWLVGLFLVAYGAKLALLGREHLDTWPAPMVTLLRVHESFMAVVVASGLVAWRMAPRGLRSADEPPSRPRHRRLGWTALLAVSGGFATATALLAGMFLALD